MVARARRPRHHRPRRRVYAGSGYDDVNLRVFDLRTGALQRTISGRAFLFGPSLGRVEPPFFSSQYHQRGLS